MRIRAAAGAAVMGCLMGGCGCPPTTATVTTAGTTHTVTRTLEAGKPKTVVHTRTVVHTNTVVRTTTVVRAVTAPAPRRSASATPTSNGGTQAGCTPGYSPCIPPGPDVDCAGGSGNGPRYVQGPITVTGSDPYGLDANGDGIGCS
jgi:hypothetical protein